MVRLWKVQQICMPSWERSQERQFHFSWKECLWAKFASRLFLTACRVFWVQMMLVVNTPFFKNLALKYFKKITQCLQCNFRIYPHIFPVYGKTNFANNVVVLNLKIHSIFLGLYNEILHIIAFSYRMLSFSMPWISPSNPSSSNYQMLSFPLHIPELTNANQRCLILLNVCCNLSELVQNWIYIKYKKSLTYDYNWE